LFNPLLHGGVGVAPQLLRSVLTPPGAGRVAFPAFGIVPPRVRRGLRLVEVVETSAVCFTDAAGERFRAGADGAADERLFTPPEAHCPTSPVFLVADV
jgi:hypothetical protein